MKFVRDCLVSETVPFHETLPKSKLRTFTWLVKVLKVNVKDKEVIVKADCNFFARMLVIAQSRAMDLQHVLKFSIGPVPWSLATPDGQLRKTTKAVHCLYARCDGSLAKYAVFSTNIWSACRGCLCSSYIKFQQVWSANRFCRRPVPSCQYQGQ